MQDKLSYYDILGYFIPGIVFAWSLVVAARLVLSGSGLVSLNAVADSIVFFVFSFLAGHLIQSRAVYHLAPKIRRLRGPDADAMVSRIFLIEGTCQSHKSNIHNESLRRRYVIMARESFGYSEEELSKLSSDTPESRQLSHDIFRRSYALLRLKSVDHTAATSSAYYMLYLGCTLAFFYSATALIVCAIAVGLISFRADPSLSSVLSGVWFPFVLSLAGFVCYTTMRKSAMRREELHVEDVFRGVYELTHSDSTDS